MGNKAVSGMRRIREEANRVENEKAAKSSIVFESPIAAVSEEATAEAVTPVVDTPARQAGSKGKKGGK
jgi:hypothetical protein